MKSQSNFRATSRESLIARLSLTMQNIQVEVKSFGGYMWVWRCVGDMFFSRKNIECFLASRFSEFIHPCLDDGSIGLRCFGELLANGSECEIQA